MSAEGPGDPPGEEGHRVGAGAAGMRVDRFLKDRFPELSRREIIYWIQREGVLRNGRPARKGAILHEGDRLDLRIPGLSSEESIVPQPDLPVRILRADAALVAVDKPSGMPTHPLLLGERDTLANFLAARYPEMEGVGHSPREPGILHRLDRDTSGVLLAARTDAAFERLRVEFEQGRVVKVYFAVVHGRPEPEGVVDRPIASRGRRAHRVQVIREEGGARGLRGACPAETHFRVLRRYRRHSLVRLRMRTGARHQLRAHLAFLGCPVVGDSLYGANAEDGERDRHPGRHLLHAAELRFFHPLKGRPVQIRSPLPADMRAFLKKLTRP